MNLKELEKTKDRIIQRGRKSTIVLKARIEKRQNYERGLPILSG